MYGTPGAVALCLNYSYCMTLYVVSMVSNYYSRYSIIDTLFPYIKLWFSFEMEAGNTVGFYIVFRVHVPPTLP